MVPPPPPPLSDDYPAWWDEVWASPLDIRRRIFCNRSLNMQHIKARIWLHMFSGVPMLALQWSLVALRGMNSSVVPSAGNRL